MYQNSKTNSKIQIVKFGGKDRPDETAHNHLKIMIEEYEDLYPGIDLWFKKKVSPDIESGSRHGILVYSGETPIGSAILKKNEFAKLCSMRVVSSHQLEGIGSLLMALVGLELRHHRTKRIHFTIPEDIWTKHLEFFVNYGFTDCGHAGTQYRLFDKEIACSASFNNIWRRITETLPDLLDDIQLDSNHSLPEIILSLHPHFAESILSGKKTVEIRSRFPARRKGALVFFYATHPSQELVGQAVIADVDIKSPIDIWEKYSAEIGCSYEEYKNYCGNRKKMTAIKFENIIPYRNKVSRAQLEVLLQNNLHPPQSYGILQNNRSWRAAISLSTILRNSI
ncbi:MAG: ASCH domain-containing protein [Candidatus Hatepunaea meridiana]|nr:ASCH domain-containing protein [Candidatus Hatepunaea meridiana]